MYNDFLQDSVKALNELTFELVCATCKNDIKCIYEKLIKSGIDKTTLGFWIWDMQNNIEIYSPTFRFSLGFENEKDFPNVPESWMEAIEPESKRIAFSNLEKHLETGAKDQYSQVVTYNKKNNNGKVVLVCHGKVVSWIHSENEKKPKVMVGVHLPESGLLKI